jgi:hypothetical protein
MALPTASDNQFPKVILEEVANDGSATVTPAADHRALFLGEDGALHLKDLSGTVTSPGGTVAAADVSIVDAGGDFTATDVEGALAELQSDAEAHLADAADAHDASAISVLDTAANFAGTDVEAVLAELQDNIDAGGSGIAPTIFDAEGDLIIASAADTAARLARGTDGQVLKSTGSSVAWENDVTTFQIVIDGGGSAVTTGAKAFIRIPFAAVITEAFLLSDVSTTTVVDVWKDTTANHPPVDADSITSATPLTLTAADSVVDTTLSSWTTTITAGDVIRFNVDSNNNAQWLNVGITVRKT